MKNTLFLAVILVFVGLAMGTSLRRPSDSEQTSNRASGMCFKSNELTCSKECDKVFLCVKDEGAWSQILVDTCENGTYCNAKTGTCGPNLTTCSPTATPAFHLGCTATGMFPDPYDCSVYHECPTLATPSTVKACEAGWTYNAMTTDCDHRLGTSVNACFPKGLIPACTKAGQSGPVPENTNIYYVCLHEGPGLKHELYKCAHGGHYLNGVCS